MIELVARGPRMVAVRTARRAEVIQELQAVFTCELWSTLRTGINPEKIHCLLCVVDENGESFHVCLGSYSVDGEHAGYYARISETPRIDSNAADIPVLIERSRNDG